MIHGSDVLYWISYDLSSEYLTFNVKVAFYIEEGLLHNKVGAPFSASISSVNNVHFLQFLGYIWSQMHFGLCHPNTEILLIVTYVE